MVAPPPVYNNDQCSFSTLRGLCHGVLPAREIGACVIVTVPTRKLRHKRINNFYKETEQDLLLELLGSAAHVCEPTLLTPPHRACPALRLLACKMEVTSRPYVLHHEIKTTKG